MTFDRETFNQYLTTSTIGQSLYTYTTVRSTNTTLWSLLQDGAPIGATVIATRQSGGRGQWGRTWESAVGGLYVSAAIAPHWPAKDSAQLTLATAWGIAKELRTLGIPVQLKWPNDLYLSQLKLGGILTETVIQRATIQQAVVGIGINWSNPIPGNAISLNQWATVASIEEFSIHSLEHLAAIVVNGLEVGLQSLNEHGIEALLPTYLEWLIGDRPPDFTLP